MACAELQDETLRVGSSDDIYRVRLEGRAELLEAVRPRFRELLDMLRAPHWEERVRGKLELLRESGPVLERVDVALTQALRRAGVEGWPERSPTLRLLHEVKGLRDTFLRTASERLASTGPASGGITAWLKALEEHARCAPREVAPSRREAMALEVLPDDLPVLKDVAELGALLQRNFSQPFDPARPLPFQAEDLEALRREWTEGPLALATCWARLTRADLRAVVVSELRKRAAWEPRHAPRTGPEKLVHAEYWFQTARTVLEGLVRERLSLVPPTPFEWTEVVFWLCERDRNEEARLETGDHVTESRAGLLGLAHELWEPLRGATPEERPWPVRRWERMQEYARRAEPEARGPAGLRVREALRTLILERSLGTPRVRGWREPDTLEAWVRYARELAG
ncbi:hypothetical protein JY651_22545 [Pyxidicoccus parkwayensis]|uniref:Uncharacterized protein n=1 Tax=Pyxidicoccus parkwayensis TaxID=2813578 RepID=A0ABX7PAM6_9BACT|nr:hypothetical protein [Pyxidicoccus parkwaysis]QSQ27521.1 hypothetical protein JY651_22545 [Pyxidicoccus parkwaysis]